MPAFSHGKQVVALLRQSARKDLPGMRNSTKPLTSPQGLGWLVGWVVGGVRCQMLNTLTDRSTAARLKEGKQGYYEQVSAFARNVLL